MPCVKREVKVMNKHSYCRIMFSGSNPEKLKLTGKFYEDSRGNRIVEVYDENRVHVHTSHSACCTWAAKVEYLEKIGKAGN